MRTAAVALILVGSAAFFLSAGCNRPAPNAPTAASTKPASITSTKPGSDVSERSDDDTRPVILCFGDSLTAGYGTEPGQSYPDYLQTLLTGKGYGYRVVNSGVSGNTSKDGLERLPRVLARKPELVVLEFGGNDGLRGLPLDQTQTNIDAMLTQLQAAGIKIALAGITLPPDYGPDYIHRFTAMYAALARRHRIPLLPFLLQGVYGVQGGMQGDATHATAQGNQQVARNVAALIEPLLKR